MSVRKATTALLEMAESEPSFWQHIARECLARMSEDEVKFMALDCEWLDESQTEGE